jgi:hypothetical protein
VGTKAELPEDFWVEDGRPEMEVITDPKYARF